MQAKLLKQHNQHLLEVGPQHVPIIIARHSKARRMTLRINPIGREVHLTLPKRTSVKEGLRFVEDKQEWLASHLHDLPTHIPFVDGALIPLIGVPHLIIHAPQKRGGVTQENGTLFVSGDETFITRRVQDWLKRFAKKEIAARALPMARSMNKSIKKIQVRDMRSRWGSCNEEGSLSFSWRLIFAPEHILDYVVAHEIAHLEEFSHSKRFWKVVAGLHPEYAKAEQWLKGHSSELYRYGGTSLPLQLS